MLSKLHITFKINQNLKVLILVLMEYALEGMQREGLRQQ